MTYDDREAGNEGEAGESLIADEAPETLAQAPPFEGDCSYATTGAAPPPDPPYLRGCTGKIGYGSKGGAIVAASRYLKRDRPHCPAPAALRSYRCPYCAKWHLTSQV